MGEVLSMRLTYTQVQMVPITIYDSKLAIINKIKIKLFIIIMMGVVLYLYLT